MDAKPLKKRKKRNAKRAKRSVLEMSPPNMHDSVNSDKRINKRSHQVHRGPFVRHRGSRDNPVVVEVINVQEPQEPEKFQKHRFRPEQAQSERSVNALTYPVSDSVPWLCVFCGKHANYSILGDLFGPYFLDSLHPTGHSVPKSPDGKGGNKDETTPSRSGRGGKRRRLASKEAALHSPTGKNPASPSSLPKETWFHEDCVIWCHGVYLTANKVQGLEEAVAVAEQTVSFGACFCGQINMGGFVEIAPSKCRVQHCDRKKKEQA